MTAYAKPIAAAIVAALLLAGCASGGTSTVRGLVQASCGEAPYPGASVAVLDASGTTIGSAQIGEPLESDSWMFCELPFEAEVPASDFYGFQLAGLEWTGIPATNLNDDQVSLYGFYSTSTGPSWRMASETG